MTSDQIKQELFNRFERIFTANDVRAAISDTLRALETYIDHRVEEKIAERIPVEAHGRQS